ncbi:MAG: PIN domain-containing protein [Acidimicrobiales bacterium]
MERLILDTAALVAGVRGQLDLDSLADTDDVSIPMVAVAEYLAGTLLDPHPGRAAAQRAFLDDVLAVVPTQNYDRAVADHHAVLLAHVRRTGTERGAHDLIIAASARAAERTILTADESARFGDLPGVAVRLIGS